MYGRGWTWGRKKEKGGEINEKKNGRVGKNGKKGKIK